MARIPSIDNSYWFGETNGFVSKKTMIEQALDANAKTDKAQSEDIKANAEAIAENAKADEQQAQDIQSNADALAENAANDEKQSEAISANADAIAENTANDEKQSEDIQANADAIAAEVERAEGAEADLQKTIEDEATRAMDAEKANADAIVTLTNNVNDSITTLVTAVQNNSNAIVAEAERAKGAEEALDGKVSAEETRAEAAEEELDGKIDGEAARAMGVEGELKDADAVLEDKILKLESSVKDELAAEADRAKAAEEALEKAVADEVERAMGVEEGLDERVETLEAKNFVEWEANGERKMIVLDNYENIIGRGVNGGAYNIAMVSKWDVADFGSNQIHMELNTKDNITVVAGADKEVVAYKSDVENAKGDAEALVTELKEGEVAANTKAIEDEAARADEAEKTLDGKIETINNTLNTLLNTSGASEVIDTFKDVEKFLEGITDSETLASLVSDAVKREADRAMGVEEGLDERVGALESVKDDYKAADEALKSELEGELADKTSHMVEWMENGQRKMIVLDNYENILGRGTDNNPYNLAMVSKWDVADFGSTSLHMELNTKDDITVAVGADKEVLAYKSDVENAKGDAKALVEDEETRAKGVEASLDAAIKDEAKRADEADEALKSELEGELADKTSHMVEWEVNPDNASRKMIVLDNYENILGKGKNGGTYNLAMVSEWDVADFGSTTIHLNLNSVDDVTVNDKEKIALQSWVEEQGYLTEHQDLSEYALKSELPSIEGLASEDWVKEQGYATASELSEVKSDLKANYTPAEFTAKLVEDTQKAFDEVESAFTSVNDVIAAIHVPTKVSELENDTNYALKSELPSVEGLAKSADIEANYQPKGEYLTEHQSLDDYALKAELPSVEGLASEDWVKTTYTPAEATVQIVKDTQKAFDDAEKMINANTAAINGLNLAVKALRDSMAETIKSEVVLGESLDEKKAYTFNPENGDLYIINSQISGEKGASNGKVMFTASTVNISSVNAHDIEGTYNLFEQGQTVDKDIEELVVSDLTIDGTLKHNIVNAYNLANDAKITLKNVKVNGCNPSLTNLVRISNYKNASGVTITFDNVSVDYMEGYNASDYEYFGFLLYQAVSGKDSSFNGTSCVDSWTVVFKDCFLNGEPVESLNFGTEKQIAYTYNFGGNGSVTSIDDAEKSNMTVRFE